MNKKLLFSVIGVLFILAFSLSIGVANYPVFYDAGGRPVYLHESFVEADADLSTIYLPAYLVKHVLPAPISDEEYLMYYGCVPRDNPFCTGNFGNANYVGVSASLPDVPITVVADRVIGCYGLGSVAAMHVCLDVAGVVIEGFGWSYLAKDKRGWLIV